ncbi:Transcription factor bHLH52 [Spatholobus suberectus]|nr:Transcription factor bHLH52 [Spatholobus suberectus]
MMALSTFFNWDTLQIPNSETSIFHESMPEEAAAPNLQHFLPYSDESFFLSNALFENYFDPTGGFLYPAEIYPPYDPFISLAHHDILPTHEDYNLLPCPKRQKYCYEEQEQEQQRHVHSSLQELTTPTAPSNFLDGFVAPYDNCCSLQQELFSEVPQHGAWVDLQCEKKGNERTISPQSVAARERRRKITEKTQELGKLVPGGPKMNTAEMLHAAAKYVKYLQAQVEMLELMKTLKEDKAAPPSEILHALVISPFVQEKLYTEERCFILKEIVITLTNHEDVQSRPTIFEDLKQLIGTDIEKKAKQE